MPRFSITRIGMLVVCVSSLFMILAFSAFAPYTGDRAGSITITGVVQSVNAQTHSVTLVVEGQTVTIGGLTNQEVALLQSQQGKTFSFQVTPTGVNSFTITSGTQPQPSGSNAPPTGNGNGNGNGPSTNSSGNNAYNNMADTSAIKQQVEKETPDYLLKEYWTPERMRKANDHDPAKGQPFPKKMDPSDPRSTVGKIFLTEFDGTDTVCSGTAVKSFNHSVVNTAGHCLYDYDEDDATHTPHWIKNLIFCPQYDNGKTPWSDSSPANGCWAALIYAVPTIWWLNTSAVPRNDFGMVIVAPNSHGALTDVVGGISGRSDLPAEQTFYAYGYPAEDHYELAGRNIYKAHYNGQTMQSCPPARGQITKKGIISITPCDLTPGSSGGPWFIKIDGNWYLNGLISGGPDDIAESPYFDDSWQTLYNYAQSK